MKYFITFCLASLLCAAPVFGSPIGEEDRNIGAYTGPKAGTAQDDNIKASLDLLHAGRLKFASKVATGTDDDLWDVDGGPIRIVDFFGVVTTLIGATATTMEITLNADTPWTDYDFSTAVAITSDSVGFRYVFTAANESVLTPLEGADGGATSLFKSWICGEGMIEQNASTTDNDGAITWYMIYQPLATGVTVTEQ